MADVLFVVIFKLKRKRKRIIRRKRKVDLLIVYHVTDCMCGIIMYCVCYGIIMDEHKPNRTIRVCLEKLLRIFAIPLFTPEILTRYGEEHLDNTAIVLYTSVYTLEKTVIDVVMNEDTRD